MRLYHKLVWREKFLWGNFKYHNYILYRTVNKHCEGQLSQQVRKLVIFVTATDIDAQSFPDGKPSAISSVGPYEFGLGEDCRSSRMCHGGATWCAWGGHRVQEKHIWGKSRVCGTRLIFAFIFFWNGEFDVFYGKKLTNTPGVSKRLAPRFWTVESKQ